MKTKRCIQIDLQCYVNAHYHPFISHVVRSRELLSHHTQCWFAHDMCNGFTQTACLPSEPAAVQDVMVTQVSNTSVVVTWTASAPAVDSTINGYQVEVLIVDVDRNKSNRTVPVGDVNTTLLEMLCELELGGACLHGGLPPCQPSACVLSKVKLRVLFRSSVLQYV